MQRSKLRETEYPVKKANGRWVNEDIKEQIGNIVYNFSKSGHDKSPADRHRGQLEKNSRYYSNEETEIIDAVLPIQVPIFEGIMKEQRKILSCLLQIIKL